MYKTAMLCCILAFASANAAPPQIVPTQGAFHYKPGMLPLSLQITTKEGSRAYVLLFRTVKRSSEQEPQLELVLHRTSDDPEAPNLLDTKGEWRGYGKYDFIPIAGRQCLMNMNGIDAPIVIRRDDLHLELRIRITNCKTTPQVASGPSMLAVLDLNVDVRAWTPLSGKPCDGVDRRLPDTRKMALQKKIARELKDPPLTVVQSFAYGGWSIVYVETDNSDPPFLFYHGDPLKTRSQSRWSGAAGVVEEEEIFDWTRLNAHGIPPQLARCFAHQVTNGGDQ